MTQKEIIRIAQEAGYGDAMSELHAPALERFACLVAAAERDACAKVLDEMADEAEADMEPSALVTYYREKAAVIRSRGDA